MDRDKQISEMAKHCTYHHNGECFAESNNPTDCDLMCEMFGLFANLEMAGYRKSADVAREIFEEIENNYADFLFDGHRNILVLTEKDFAELKKKYTESEKDNG